jgi:signal transduction histidine kinase
MNRVHESRRLHDIRNQLSIIVGFCELLLQEIPEHDRKHADLLEVSKAANTAVALLEDMREGL